MTLYSAQFCTFPHLILLASAGDLYVKMRHYPSAPKPCYIAMHSHNSQNYLIQHHCNSEQLAKLNSTQLVSAYPRP